MRSVADFYQDCLRNADQQGPLDLLLLDSVGCVLAEDITAPSDLPAQDISACDGYAVRAADTVAAPVILPVVGVVEAGSANASGLAPGTAVRVASGATLPVGADAVVPLDGTDQGLAQVTVARAHRTKENIRFQGEDMRSGQVIVSSGTRLGPAQIAAIAAVGRQRVLVHPRPRVVIISVGDELLENGASARPGHVFDVNGQALVAAATEAGAETYRAAIVPDDRASLRRTIDDQQMRSDLIITTGGLSHGSGNTVRDTLGALGTVRFDQVAAAPGAILGVGTVSMEGDDDAREIPIFCLPGDPVAAQVCFEVYVRPALRKMQGWKKLNRPSVAANVTQSLTSPLGIRQFVRVRISGDPTHGYQVRPLGDPDANSLSALASSNALAVIPEDVTSVAKGQSLTCMLLD